MMLECPSLGELFLRAVTHQAGGQPMMSHLSTSFDGVFHLSALVGLTSVGVRPVQHIE